MCFEEEAGKAMISQSQNQIQYESGAESDGREQGERKKKNWRVSWERSGRVLMGKSLKSSPKHVPLSRAGIQRTSAWPIHLAQLLIMAALWSAPPCKDIFAPFQRPASHLSQFSAEQREEGFRRKSKIICCDRLLDFLLPALLLFGLSGFYQQSWFASSLPFFFFLNRSYCRRPWTMPRNWERNVGLPKCFVFAFYRVILGQKHIFFF